MYTKILFINKAYSLEYCDNIVNIFEVRFKAFFELGLCIIPVSEVYFIGVFAMEAP